MTRKDTSPTLLQGLISGQLLKDLKKWLSILPADLPYLAMIWLIPLAVYLKTLPDSLYFIDAGVTLAAAYILGIPTPPGYPTTTLLGHLFTLLPIGEPLYRMQLFSITTSLATLTLVYFFVQRLFNSNFFMLIPSRTLNGVLSKVDQTSVGLVRLLAFSSSMLLAFCYQFWSQTLNVQPYIFTDLMLMTAIYVLTWITTDSRSLVKGVLIAVVLAAVAAGGSTVMVFMIFPAVIIVLCYLWNELGLGRIALVGVVGVVIVASVYSYLPIRAMQHPFLNWGDPETPQLFMNHVQGLGLSFNDPTTNKVTGFTGSPSAFIRVAGKYFYLLWMQFTPVALPLLLAGFYYLWRKNRTLTLILGSIPLTNLIFGGLWLSGNQESWFLFSYMIFSIVMGVGLIVLWQWIKRIPRVHIGGVCVLALVVISPLIYWMQYIDRSGDHAMADYSYNLYANLPKDAVLIGIYDTFQAATLDHHEIKADRQDVFPVMTNMIYVLPWYREHLRLMNPDLLPKEIDNMTKFASESEYSNMLNYYIGYLLKKGRSVYVTQPVFSRSVLVGSNAGVFTPDPQLFKTIPSGLTTKIVATDSAEAKDIALKDSDFQFHFTNPEQYLHPYYFLEQGYQSSYQDMVAEYAVSYIAYAEKLMEVKQAPLGGGAGGLGSMFGGGNSGAGSVNMSAGSAVTAEDKKKAMDYLQKAYAIAPKSLEVINRLAIAYANQGDFKKTGEFFEKAKELDPSNLNLQFNLAKAYLDGGKSDQARTMLRDILVKAQDAQVAKQASNLLSVISSSDNAPLNWQTFKNDEMNLKFFYPEDFSVSFAGQNVVKLSNNAKGLDELTFLFYGKKLKEGELIDDIGVSLPFVMDGISLGTQQVQIPSFTAKVKTYATGEKTNLLFLLRHNDSGFAIRVSPGNSRKAAEFGAILQSVRPLNP